MKRRTFIQNSSLVAMSTSTFGTLLWNGKKFIGNTPTTTDILGPFYRPGAPVRKNIIPPNSSGIPMNLKGTIFKEDGITPVKKAFVEIWQCDENEYYDNSSDEYLFRGALNADKGGKYEFNTIVPVPYKANPNDDSSWRPAHIHMRVSVPDQQDLITQIYFQGDKYIETDNWASTPDAENRILKITKHKTGLNEVSFDVVMQKEFPLEKEVYSKITGLYKMDDKRNIEFIQKDDLLFMKLNGQLREGLKYIGNNTFKGGVGAIESKFELLEKGSTKVNVTIYGKTSSGEKFLKYKE